MRKNGFRTKITNKIAPSKSINEVSISIPCNNRKDCGLDWAESSWTRWIYVVSWSWINPILNISSKRQLTDDDLFNLSTKDECSHLLNRIENVWKINQNKSKYINIWTIIIKTYWKEYLIAGLISLPAISAQIAQPLFIRQIVLNINDSNAPSYIGYLYAIGLGLATITQAFSFQQFGFRSVRVGLHVRIGLSSLIYKKLLSLPTNEIMKTTTGHIINLISNDASKFEELCIPVHFLWIALIQALIIFGLIWNEIGIPTLFGYCVLLLLIPFQLFLSKRVGIYKRNIIQWTDKRLKVINEILNGCQIVKMYRWEESLENIVHNIRKHEFNSIRKASRIRAINFGCFFSTLPLISLATFAGSWLINQNLSPENIFTVLAFFSIMRNPLLGNVPVAIAKLSESMIAAKRISDFMNLFTQIPRKTFHEYSNNEHGSIFMNNASFAWDATQSCQLMNINLNINNGSLVGIIGAIGSSKSSLLSAILGEISLVDGISQVYGKIAYVSQIPWIYSGTIRENILFCKNI
jgi:ABC-type multidrug transport system fused ATPase/permease subunit